MTHKAPRELKLKNVLKKVSVVRDGSSEGHMIKCLLINFVGLENIQFKGASCARSLRHDFEPNIFPPSSPHPVIK